VIVFENPGEIDLRSISTFGVSVKETSNPIGFFGTGLKYAIAVLLRTGHSITIYSGLRVVTFGTEMQDVRGQQFGFVTMAVDGGPATPIGFTTELGKTWDVWMAYRELACNCKDETGQSQHEFESPQPEAGTTKVVVVGEAFEIAFAQSSLYLLEDEARLTVDRIEIRDRPGRELFYRGVRVMQFQKPALYTYNCLTKLDLTEDRTIKHSFYPVHYITGALLQCEDEEVLRNVITAGKDTFEATLDFSSHGTTPSDAFLRVAAACAADRMCKVNLSAVKVLQDTTRQEVAPREILLTDVQQASAIKALAFCGKLGFHIADAYPVKFVETLGEGVLGLAAQQTIFISERVFEIGGAKQLAATLIEEYLHLRYGYVDCTRELQNYLFEKVVSLGEELQGEPL
jgi:hypothetical protein